MFRAAVATALQMAQDGTSGLIAGCTPAQFVCGMSADLGVCCPLQCAHVCEAGAWRTSITELPPASCTI